MSLTSIQNEIQKLEPAERASLFDLLWEALPQKSNPTNGSWWIVQIQPKEEASNEMSESHQRQLVDCSDPA